MCVGLCVSFSAGLTSFHLKISFLGSSLMRHGVQSYVSIYVRKVPGSQTRVTRLLKWLFG